MTIETARPINNMNMKNFIESSKKDSKSAEIDAKKIKTTDTNTAQKSVVEETLKYFQLFLTEMRHQDPYNTVETKDMTEQMLNIHLAEQAINTNRNLEKLIELSENQVSYVGKYVQTLKMNDKVIGKLENGQLNQQFKLPEDTKNVHVSIKNAEENILVKTMVISGKAGMNNFVWDGRDNSGNQLADGKYIIDIAATNEEGRKFLDVELASTGKVESAFKEDKEIRLVLENGEIIKLEDIRSVYDNLDNKKTQENELNENLKKLNAYLKTISLNND